MNSTYQDEQEHAHQLELLLQGSQRYAEAWHRIFRRCSRTNRAIADVLADYGADTAGKSIVHSVEDLCIANGLTKDTTSPNKSS